MTLVNDSGDRPYLIYLRRLLVQRFSSSELRTLCFDLNIDLESIVDSAVERSLTKPDLVRQLIAYLTQRGRIPELVAYIRRTRDDIPLEAVPHDTSGVSIAAGATWAPSPEAVQAIQATAEAWIYNLPGQPMSVPTILDRVCLIASQGSGRRTRGGLLRALDLATGVVCWEHHFEGAVVGGLARVAETQALVSLPGAGRLPGRSALIAVDSVGRILWRAESDAQQISAPAASSRFGALTADSHELMLLDLETGEESLAATLPIDVALAAPAVDDERVYVPCLAPTLLAVDFNGELCWRFDIAGVLAGVQLSQTPLVIGSLVLTSLSSGAVLALSRDRGRLVWEAQVGPRGKPLTVPVSDGRRVFVAARDGVYALGIADGAHQWVFRTGAHVTAPPALADDLLCVAATDRHLYGLDPRTGELLWRHRMSQEIKTPPALAEGAAEGPYAVVVDCVGGVVALNYPVPAVVHEAAGRWQKAARAWEAEGDLERAAEAWQHYADDPAEEENAGDQRAQAWANAAHLWALTGAADKATGAQERHAKALKLPFIVVEVRHAGLLLGAWSRLKLVISNRGHGVARNLIVRVAGDQFDGQIAQTQQLPTLPKGRTKERELDVKPLAHGDSVPLHVQVAYLDENGEPHRQEESLYVSVAQEAAQRVSGAFRIPPEPGLASELFNAARPGSLAQVPVVDLEIRVGRGVKDFTVEVTLNRDQVFSGGHLDKAILDWIPSGDMVQDGRYLFGALLRDDTVRKAWHRARGQAEMRGIRRRVRLRIDDAAAALHQLPWELMHDDDIVLAASDDSPFSRYLPVQRPWGRPLDERPIRVLGVIANPQDLAARYDLVPLDVEMERYLLASAFAGIDPRRTRLTFLKPPVTLDALSRALLEGYHWLHFVGHGRYNARQQRIDLLMEDNQGSARAIADHLFSRMLAHQGAQPQLVFLSVCRSAMGPDQHILSGLAPRLVRVGVPAVVAMRGRVQMRSAQKVTRVFYEGLAEHGMVDRALNQARSALLAAELPNVASPVLFMRLASGCLWEAD